MTSEAHRPAGPASAFPRAALALAATAALTPSKNCNEVQSALAELPR